MNKLKTVLGLLFAGCIIAAMAMPRCDAAQKEKSETRIKSLRFSVKGNRTRLIFDAEGATPKQIGPASSDGISVFFTHMTAKLPDRAFKDAKAAARQVKFRRESSFFEVLFREKNTSVSSTVKKGKSGEYTLTLELTPSANPAAAQPGLPGKSTADFAEKTAEKAPPIEIKKVETSELFGSKTSQQVRSATSSSGAGSTRNAKQDESPSGSVSKSRSFVEPDANALALYASANEKFEDCSRNLLFCAPEIIEAYGQAISAGPQSSQAPLAIYRMALAQLATGSYVKADRLFRQVTSDWPENPVACRCWIGIGKIYVKKQSYLEAMEAFRWALRCATEKNDKAAAYYEVGKTYQILGANKEALEMLESCIGQEPGYYTKEPGLFRFIGEAHFALGNFDKAKENLFRYINYQQGSPDQDIILAKIAEIFLIQGDVGAAGRMYVFIGKYYTDSEGDLICKIRRAELMEKDDPDRAISMYEGLRGKDLSPTLRRIVLIKLAGLYLKKGKFARGLDLMDDTFPTKKDGTSPEGISELREKILSDLVKQYFFSKDFIKVVKLHDKYRRVFDSSKSLDVLEQIAESYASLKFYTEALDIYDGLIAKGRKKGDDLLLRCAVYALRINDNGRAFQFCKLAQSEAADLKKSEILGHIYFRDQKYADALKSFSKVTQKGKEFELEDPDSYEAYGYCLYQTKKFDEAISVLQKAVQRANAGDAGSRRSMLITLSKCFSELKQYRKAADMMETAISVSAPDRKNELLYEISKLYTAAEQMDKAVQSLNQIKATEDPFWSAVAQQQINTIDMGQGKTVSSDQ